MYTLLNAYTSVPSSAHYTATITLFLVGATYHLNLYIINARGLKDQWKKLMSRLVIKTSYQPYAGKMRFQED